MAFSVWSTFSPLVLAFAVLAYAVWTAVYRIYLSPISHFPGPKLAALTLWYEFYYEIVLRGQFTFHIRDLHSHYGPVVRINPYELHISDPAYIDLLYSSSAGGKKRNKWQWYTKLFGTPEATFSTVEHDHHKMRRAALNPLFSKASVRRLQPVLDERLERLMEGLRLAGEKGEVVNVCHAFAAFTNDVVQQYSYGHSDHCLEKPDFDPSWHNGLLATAKSGSLSKQMIWLQHLVQSSPSWLTTRIFPDLSKLIQLRLRVEKQISQLLAEPRKIPRDFQSPTIFTELLDSDLPPAEKTAARLGDEAFVVVGAGTLTTAWTLSITVYYLLTSPRILSRLKADLKAAIPDPQAATPLSVLDNIPYLAAVVQEALRLSYGLSTRLARIAPNEAMPVVDARTGKTWIIPPNTPTSMTSTLIHHDESLFPDSHSFIPERWIENPRLDRYLLSFSKGTRQCIGINLAYAELYMCLAAIFRRFGSSGKDGVRDEGDEGVLELSETDLSDVQIHADCFVPLARVGSQGVQIRLKR